MKQALFILAVALYLVSLCACGDQKIQSDPAGRSGADGECHRRNDRSADCNSGAAACFG